MWNLQKEHSSKYVNYEPDFALQKLHIAIHQAGMQTFATNAKAK
ncbi:hypothetical protein [Paenibacillus pabuli]|nr:hypothetical protein [Paenibacillus pabuli]